MGNLSDKDVLEMLSSFPKHELSTTQRTNTLKAIGEYHPRKSHFNFQMIAGLAAVFLLAIVGSIFYITSGPQEKGPSNQGAIEKETTKSGVYFALVDKDSKLVFSDSNYGIPNKVSIVLPKKEIVMYDQDLMMKSVKVYLWGKGYHSNKILNVKATHLATGIEKQLDNSPVHAGEYDADASASTYLRSLDQPGIWNLEFSIGGGKKIGAFTINVKKPYVLIGKSTLLISESDIYPGVYKDAIIEVTGEKLPTELELELFSLEEAKSSVFTFKKESNYARTDGLNVSVYKGNFQINNTGRYRFSVLQQSQLVYVLSQIQELPDLSEGYVIMKGDIPYFSPVKEFANQMELSSYIDQQLSKEYPSNYRLSFKNENLKKEFKTGDRIKIRISGNLESAPAILVVEEATKMN